MTSIGRVDKVSDRTAKAILATIRNGALRPGDMLPPEARMLTDYGVSRASLREALRILEVAGVVRMKAGPGGGPVVASANASDFGRSASLHFHIHGVTMRELVEARVVIEPVLARRAAEQVTPEDGATLQAALAQEAPHAGLVGAEWENVTADFHMCVARMAKNNVLSLFSDSLARIQNERLGALVPQDERAAAHRVHERIAKAIIAGDGDEAEHLMRAHLQALSRHLRRFGPAALDEPIAWL